VEPARDLGAGDWFITIRELSDDFGNGLNTTEYPLTITKPAVDPNAPEVVWVAVHDNIYDIDRNGSEYKIADLVYVQFSKNMDNTLVNSLRYYSVNKTDFPAASYITSEPNVLYDDSDPNNPLWGTLVTIHLPYSFLGETDRQWFITRLERFTSLPEYGYDDTVLPIEPGDPYAPVEDWAVFIDGRITDDTRDKLALGVDYDVVSTYMRPEKEIDSVPHPTVIQAHVTAYVNADDDTSTALQSRNDIASLSRALASPHVNLIRSMVPTATNPPVSRYYDNLGATGAVPFATLSGTLTVVSDSLEIVSTEDLGNLNFTFTSPTAKSFVISAPAIGDVTVGGISGKGSEISLTATDRIGDVTAANAESFTVSAPIIGNVTVSDISGEVSVTAAGSNVTAIGVVAITNSKAASITVASTDIVNNTTVYKPITSVNIIQIADAEAGSINVSGDVTVGVVINAAEATSVAVNGEIGTDVTIGAPKATTITVTADVDNDVAITAAAPGTTIRTAGTIDNNLTITSTNTNTTGDTVRIDGDVRGTVTINDPAATYYLGDGVTVGAWGIVTGSPGSLHIGTGAIITTLTIEVPAHRFLIYNGGTITTLVVQSGSGYVHVLDANGKGNTTGTFVGVTNPVTSAGVNDLTLQQRATTTSL
jgi:hypothetical protein